MHSIEIEICGFNASKTLDNGLYCSGDDSPKSVKSRNKNVRSLPSSGGCFQFSNKKFFRTEIVRLLFHNL